MIILIKKIKITKDKIKIKRQGKPREKEMQKVEEKVNKSNNKNKIIKGKENDYYKYELFLKK